MGRDEVGRCPRALVIVAPDDRSRGDGCPTRRDPRAGLPDARHAGGRFPELHPAQGWPRQRQPPPQATSTRQAGPGTGTDAPPFPRSRWIFRQIKAKSPRSQNFRAINLAPLILLLPSCRPRAYDARAHPEQLWQLPRGTRKCGNIAASRKAAISPPYRQDSPGGTRVGAAGRLDRSENAVAADYPIREWPLFMAGRLTLEAAAALSFP